MHFLSKFALCLAAIVFLAAGQLHACSDYVHLWRPVKEERGSAFSPEGIALFIDHVVSQLKSPGKVYKLSVNPASDVSDALKDSIMKSAVLVSKIQAVWAEASTPFAGEASASIWLDFVKPERMVYLWEDQNKPPFAMFRCGEIDTARVRVLVQNSQGKIEMIDELPYMFLLESDFMLPGWLSA